jgi:hypothetical protein
MSPFDLQAFPLIGDLELDQTESYTDQAKSFIVGFFDQKEVQHYST